MIAGLVRLVPTVFIVGVAGAVLYVSANTPPQEKVALRYAASAQNDPQRHVLDRFQIPGATNEGLEFDVITNRLNLRTDAPRNKEISLAIPPLLQETADWSVMTNQERSRAAFVCNKGLAVWNWRSSTEACHFWLCDTETLSGRDVTTQLASERPLPLPQHAGSIPMESPGKIFEYEIVYNVSPDLRFAAIYSARQNHLDSVQKRPGVVTIRDLESGEDIQQLQHSAAAPLVDQVTWSVDSRRLATSSCQSEAGDQHLTVWDVQSGQEISSRQGAFFHCAFNESGDTLMVVNQCYPYTISILDAETGAERVSRVFPRLRRAILSEDGRSVAAFCGRVGKGDSVELLDAETLRPRWSSSCEGMTRIASFHPRADELIVTWVQYAEGSRCYSGVRGWNLATGTIILDSPCRPEGKIAFTRDGSILAGMNRYELLETTADQ